jgi:predicted Zn-dependent protease
MVVRPTVSYYFYRSGIQKAGREDVVGAIRSCRRALSISPSEAVYHNALGKLYARMYDRTGGIGYMYISHRRHESAVKANPLDRVYWEDFADFAYDHRRNIGEEEAYSDAAKLLREAVKTDPYNPFLRRKLAVVYVEGGSFDKAIRELKGVIGLEPNFHSARFMLACVYQDLGMGERAVEQYQILETNRMQHLELRVRNEYEKRLIDFDWSLLPEM